MRPVDISVDNSPMLPFVSVIVPVLDEAQTIVSNLAPLQSGWGGDLEIIVVDGGSGDATVELAKTVADRVEVAPRGRALQMNAVAAADILLFLHADTRLPERGVGLIRSAAAEPGRTWGRFDVRISSCRIILRLVGHLMNLRSRWSGIATGDQAMFVLRREFERVGGFPAIPLMEDIELSKRLKVLGPPVCLRARVTTSSRRWEANGVLSTILLMWRLRWAYFLGADPADLAIEYAYRYEP